MATINKRPSGKWQATIRRGGRSSSKTFSKHADAVTWAREAEVRAERNGVNPSTIAFCRRCGAAKDSAQSIGQVRSRSFTRSTQRRQR